MDLSLIYVNYKSKGLIRQNLMAIQKFRRLRDSEVIVIDNNSRDGTKDLMCERFADPSGKVQYYETSKNRGFAYGVNLGIKKSMREYSLIMNPDIVVNEQAVENLLNFMQAHPRAGIAGPRLRQPDGSIQNSAYRFPTFLTPLYRRTLLKQFTWAQKKLHAFILEQNTTAANACMVDWIQGSCMLVRKESLNEVGLMDERFFMYFEDTDWCRRFIEKGWQVWYVPEAEMVHYFNRWSAEYEGIGALFHPATWIHVKSWLYYFWKWRKYVHQKTRY